MRAIGQALVLTPITAITTAGIAPSDAGAASGLSNMLRNLGGAVGTATLATMLTKREQFHSNIIGQSVTLPRRSADRIAAMTDYFQSRMAFPTGGGGAWAIVALGDGVRRQALIMGFSDTFAVIGVVARPWRPLRCCSPARQPEARAGRQSIDPVEAVRLTRSKQRRK